jgi:hypothetical protein
MRVPHLRWGENLKCTRERTGHFMKRRYCIGLMVLAAATLGSGCNRVDRVPGHLGDGDETATGEVRVALVAEGASGNVYRLRNAEFEIWGYWTDTFLTVSSEDYLDDDTIDLSLPPDEYEVFLEPGFRMERIGMAQDTDTGPGPDQDAGPSSGDTDTVFGITGDALRGAKPGGPLDTEGVIWDSDVVVPDSDVGPWDSDPVADGGLPGSGYVEAVLISENPVLVEVRSRTTSFVNFTFLVGDEIVGPEDGILSIGISVEEIDPAECMDSFEPNDIFEEAAPVTFEPPVEAVICGGDSDFFSFDAPLSEGDGFVLDVRFSHAISDLDIFLYDASGELIDDSTSTSNHERVIGLADGGTYILEIYPYSFGRANHYTVEMSTVSQSDCCTASILPGCVDAEIQDCVCGLDYSCCEEEFDAFCAMEAMAECGLSCNAADPDSDCCAPGANPGCTDDDIEACVCGIDPFCCAAPFDSNCVGIAQDACGAVC